MAAPLHGQQNMGCQKTWGKGVKRTEIIIINWLRVLLNGVTS